jgi:Flp pilus assembly protein TadD
MQVENTSKLQMTLVSAGLVLLILATFEPLRHNEFIIYDDYDYITENPHIQSGFTRDSIIWAFTSGYASNWHPLTWLSHMVDIELFELNPLGHHLHNLLLHIASTILLFWLLHNMTGAVWRSAFVAMAFGIHPLHVESVAWAAERKDVLSMLFFMLTVAAYLYYVRQGGKGRYLLVMLCFALSLMAKPMLVTLPLVLLLLDFWPLGRVQKFTNKPAGKNRPMPALRLITEKVPLLMLTTASCIVTYLVQKASGSVNPLDFHTRVLNALVSYTAYIGKIFWPHNLAVLYPYPGQTYSVWLSAAALILLLIFSGFALHYHTRRPYFITGWFWYVVTLIPVIGLIQVGNQAMADRYTYLPSIGVFLIISWTAARFSAKWRYQKILMGTLSGLLALAMVIGTRTQLAYWKDSAALFEHTLVVTNNNYIAHSIFGKVLEKQGRLDEAVVHINKSLQIWPDFPDANINMASILIKRKQFDDAMVYLHKTMEITPDNPRVYYYMGSLFQAQRKSDEAIHAYERTLQLKPNYTAALNNLAWLLAATPDSKIQNPTEAITLARKACQLSNFKNPSLLDTLSVAYASAGQFKEAQETAQKAMDLAIAAGQKSIAEDISRRLQLYQAGKPYYESSSKE